MKFNKKVTFVLHLCICLNIHLTKYELFAADKCVIVFLACKFFAIEVGVQFVKMIAHTQT